MEPRYRRASKLVALAISASAIFISIALYQRSRNEANTSDPALHPITDHDVSMEHDKSTIEGVIRERVRLHDWYLRRGLDRPLFTEHSDEDIKRVASAFRSSGVATPLCFWMNESPSPSWVYTFRNKSPGEGFIFLKMNYILCDEFMVRPDEREIAKAILSHIPNPSDADRALVDELAFVVRKRRIRGPQLVKP